MLPPPPPPRQLMPQPSARVDAAAGQDGGPSSPETQASPMSVSPKHPRSEAADAAAERPDAATSSPDGFHARFNLVRRGVLTDAFLVMLASQQNPMLVRPAR